VLDQPAWVYGDISPEAIRAVRKEGRVRNVAHWDEQTARIGTVKLAHFIAV
jgi:hypothetical protein